MTLLGKVSGSPQVPGKYIGRLKARSKGFDTFARQCEDVDKIIEGMEVVQKECNENTAEFVSSLFIISMLACTRVHFGACACVCECVSLSLSRFFSNLVLMH